MTFGLVEDRVPGWVLFPGLSDSWLCAGVRNIMWALSLSGEVGASNTQFVPIVLDAGMRR